MKTINKKYSILIFLFSIFSLIFIYILFINNKNGIIIYGKYFCPFTIQVRKHLDKLNIKYKYIEGTQHKEKLINIQNKENYFKVPLVFKNGIFIGGSEETLKIIK